MGQQKNYYSPLDTLHANLGHARFWKNKYYNKTDGTLKISPNGPVVDKHDETKPWQTGVVYIYVK
jgi:hypothetical protein